MLVGAANANLPGLVGCGTSTLIPFGTSSLIVLAKPSSRFRDLPSLDVVADADDFKFLAVSRDADDHVADQALEAVEHPVQLAVAAR